MKTVQLVATLTTAAAAVADAASLKSLLLDDASPSAFHGPATMDAAAAALAADTTLTADEKQRRLNCWGSADSYPPAAWHPQYDRGWAEGFCRLEVDCNSPSYSTELACCKGAYAGQVSGYCLQQLPNPPTTSPTGDSGLDFFYPDYNTAWPDAGCINKAPKPSGRPEYSTMLACCKGAYGGQVSGKCLSMLPSPPTTSPTPAGGLADFWYPDYDTAWSEAGCLNTLPLPYPNVNDRPNYETQVACCKGAYGGQVSGICLSQLPTPPTTAPTGAGGLDYYYPDYNTAWPEAGCINTRPMPSGRPTYDTMLACCKGAYGGQVSGKCLAALPTPPTTSPTTAGGLDVFYPDYDLAWNVGKCINDRPMPSGRPTYTTKAACCNGAYGNQQDHKCACDDNPCYSCKCGDAAHRTANGCSLDCGTSDD